MFTEIDESKNQPLFRGIDKETNQWVYGFGWFKTNYKNIDLKELDPTEQDAVLMTENGTVICSLDTIGQFTGIYDKNGKKTFDGDLLYWHGALRRIVYRNDKAAFMAKRLGSWQKSYFYLTDIANRFIIAGDIHHDNLPAHIDF